MREATAKTMSVLMGVGMVASSAAMVATPGVQALADTDPAAGAVQTAKDSTVAAPTARVADVAGVFAFDQSAVTDNRDIASVFRSAAATLCTSLPKYAVEGMGSDTLVSGPADTYGIVVGDSAQSDGDTVMIGCVCASNVAGGGAAANARVTGVSLQSLATRAGA